MTKPSAKTKTPETPAPEKQAPAARYVAIRAFWHKSALFQIGDVLDVDAETAQPYIDAGVLAEAD